MDFLAFEFDLQDAAGPLEEGGDWGLEVLADFRLFAGGSIVYRDPDCPVIELALQLRNWLETDSDQHIPFSYDSRVSALPGVFRILKGAQGWYLTSIQQELPSSSIFTLDQVVVEVRRFIKAVDRQVEETYGFRALAL